MSSRSEQLIEARLQTVFNKYEANEETKEFYQEVFADLKEATLDHLVKGETPEEAVDAVFSDVGDLNEPLQQMAALKKNVMEDLPYQDDDNSWQWQNEQDFEADTKDFNRDMQDFADEMKNVAKDISKNVKPFATEMLSMVDQLVGEPLFAPGKIKNFQDLEDAWWRLQDNLDLSEQKTEITDQDIESIYIKGQYDNIGIFPSMDDHIHIIEKINQTDNPFFSEITSDGDLEIVSAKRPLFSWKTKNFLTIYLPTNFAGYFYQKAKVNRLWLGGLMKLSEVELNVAAGSLMLRNLITSDIVVRLTSGSADVIGLQGNDFDFGSTSGSLNLSQIQADDLNLTANSGSIRLADIKVNDLEAETSSGSLIVDGLQGDWLKAKASSGSLKISHAQLDEIDLRTASGSIVVDQIDANGKMDASSGNLKGSRITLNGDLNLTTASGVIKFNLSPQDYYFDLRTISGSIRKNKNAHIKVASAKQVAGKVGTEPQFEVRASSKSGVIVLN